MRLGTLSCNASPISPHAGRCGCGSGQRKRLQMTGGSEMFGSRCRNNLAGWHTETARALEMLKTSRRAILRAESMVEDPPATARKPKRKGGRPSRAEASAKALRGLDLTAIDPVAILREIAA